MPRMYRELYYPSCDLEICQENIDMFFRFMYNRHLAWYRRFIEKRPQEEWTDDPILKVTKYTNIYRELDRGTIWYIQEVVEPYIKKYNDKYNSIVRNEDFSMFANLIWKTAIYRLCNRVETFYEVGFPKYTKYDRTVLHNSFWEKLHIIEERNEAVMTSAHLTCPTTGGKTKVEGFITAINDLHEKLPNITERLQKNNLSMPKIFELLKEVYCIGNFTSYEIMCDLMYSHSIGSSNDDNYNEDDWANAGPGAIEGIRMLYPSTSGKINQLNRMKQLRDEQHQHFERLGLEFPFYEKYTKGHLSLRSIEHSLCEFQKYWLQRLGLGKQRMIFRKDANRKVSETRIILDPNCGDRIIYVKD